MESVISFNPETAYDNLLTSLIFLISSCDPCLKGDVWFRKIQHRGGLLAYARETSWTEKENVVFVIERAMNIR